MAGNSPPAILILGKFAHFCAVSFSGFINTVAIAQWRGRPREQDRDLVSQGSGGKCSQQDRYVKSLAKSAALK